MVSASTDGRAASDANLIPFAPGRSGNPAGRPKGQKGFAAMVRRRTHQGRDLLDFVFGLMQDTSADPRVRLDAATWLANRAFGAPAPDPADVPPGVGTLTIREIVIERSGADGGA